ncbi:unnamed protein product [Polarella glacialis]|uniref:RNA-binding S4 domain-containing protein n=1 Tax=Polarella glacialis TaxID=89957 RepID=A0A813H0L4_POLGL|nr:unnamed protein product [Polarella glacialis]
MESPEIQDMVWRMEPGSAPHKFQVGDLVCPKGDRDRAVVEHQLTTETELGLLEIRSLADGKTHQVPNAHLSLVQSHDARDRSIGIICAETVVYRKMARILPSFGEMALDVGSATGACTAILARSCGKENVLGIDISIQEVEHSRKIHEDLRFECLDVLKERDRLREIAVGVSILFIDIGGIREITALMRILNAVTAEIRPRICVIKNRALWDLVHGTAAPDGSLDGFAERFPRVEHQLLTDMSPYQYWQFWRSCANDDVSRYLRVFSGLPLEEIEALEALPPADFFRQAKVALADAATALQHGRAAAETSHATASAAFSGGSVAVGLPTLEAAVGTSVVDLYLQLGLVKSKSEACRVVQGGGARLNGQTVTDHRRVISEPDFEAEKLQLSIGKHKHGIIIMRSS